jgi:hypothetical protein
LIGGSDEFDYFRISPGSGADKCLQVRVTFSDSLAQLSEAALSIYDAETDALVTQGWPDGNSVLARLPGAVDGGEYFVRVQRLYNSFRKIPYSLEMNTFTGYPLQIEARLDDGGKLKDASFDLRGGMFIDQRTLVSNDQGLTPPLMLEAGEVLNIECFRYGYNIDRSTQRIEMPAAPLTVAFEGDSILGPDSLEPNETSAATLGELPLEFHASFAKLGDYSDKYSFDAPAGTGLHVRILPGDQGGNHYAINVYDGTNTYVDGTSFNDVLDTWFSTGGGGTMRIELHGNGTDSEYEVELSSGTAHPIVGSVFYELTPLAGARIYEPTFDRKADVSAGGNFNLGLFPPGTYTLYCSAPGYVMENPSYTVTVTEEQEGYVDIWGAGLTHPDATEPNDTGLTAYLLTDNTALASKFAPSLGDTSDWYKLESNFIGGYSAVIEINYQPWQKDPTVEFYTDPLGSPLASATCSGVGYQRLIYPLRGLPPDAMYIRISGQPCDYTVKMSAQLYLF